MMKENKRGGLIMNIVAAGAAVFLCTLFGAISIIGINRKNRD